MFINGIAVFFYLYTIEGCSLNNIQKGNPILLLGHPLFLQHTGYQDGLTCKVV